MIYNKAKKIIRLSIGIGVSGMISSILIHAPI